MECETDLSCSMACSSMSDGQAKSSRVHGDFAMSNLHCQFVISPRYVTLIIWIDCPMKDHAQAALSLHQTELAPGRLLSVLISDPERRKERTDADADAREVHVAGLSKFATKDDLMKLFSAVRVAT